MVRRVGLTTDFESVRSALDAVTVVDVPPNADPIRL